MITRRVFLMSTTATGSTLLISPTIDTRALGPKPVGGPAVFPGPPPSGAATPAQQIAAIPVTFNNLSKTNSYATPTVSFIQPFADGDIPLGGSVTATDSNGKPLTVQMDALTTWPSGKLASAAITIVCSETFAASSSKPYTLTPSASAPVTTLAAGWGGNPNNHVPDIRCEYSGGDAGQNTYTVKLTDIISKYRSYPWGTNNPVGGYEFVKSGPNCVEWHAWQYLINDNTSVPHGYIRCDMWVKALSPTGPYEVDVRTSSPNMWGTISSGSERYNQPLGRFAANLTIKNGSAVVSNQGGIGDDRTVTFPNTVFDVSTKRLIGTNVLGATGFYLTSSGSLPAGLDSKTIYWLAPIQGDSFSNPYLVTARLWLGYLQGFNGPPPAWQPNTAYYPNGVSFVTKGGMIYCCQSAGTSASSGGPTGVGAAITDGTCTWQNVTVPFTSQGSGTITATPIYSVFPNSAWAAGDANGDPIWVGTGTRPQIFPGHDFNYLTQKSKAILPYNNAATALTTTMPTPIYVPNSNVGGLLWYQDTTGDGSGDQRVGWIDNFGLVALYLPTDPYYVRASLTSALSYNQQLNSYMFDERNGLPFTGNNGPNRNGTPYANFPNPQPNFMLYNYAGVRPKNFGVGNWAPWSTALQDYCGYGGQGYSDTSHVPCPTQAPYLKTARGIFMEQMIGLAMYATLASYANAPSSGGVQYFCVAGTQTQTRGWAWALRNVSQGLYFTPDAHPFKPVLKDFYTDSYAFQVQQLGGMPPQAQVFGVLPTAPRPAGGGQSPWQYAYLDAVVSLDKWRGGLTSGAVTGINLMFNYMDAFWKKYTDSVPGSLYYAGAYDEQWASNENDYTTCYTTAAAVFRASVAGNSGMAAPYPSGGGIYDPYGTGYVFTNPRFVTSYPLIVQAALKARVIADPTNGARTTELSQISAQIAAKSGVSSSVGGATWAYASNGVNQNYHAYSIF